jgi:hypothetical protein
VVVEIIGTAGIMYRQNDIAAASSATQGAAATNSALTNYGDLSAQKTP